MAFFVLLWNQKPKKGEKKCDVGENKEKDFYQTFVICNIIYSPHIVLFFKMV